MTLDRSALEQDLIRDEGLRLKPYPDSLGKMTIGIGRNLDDRGITKDEAMILLSNDISNAISDLDSVIPEWRYFPEDKARALANMAFQLGRVRFCNFVKMLSALRRHDWQEAGREARESRWYKQVPIRAERIARILEAE